VAIRTEADRTHFRQYPTEKELARRLDEAFDITFGARIRDLSFWLAEPKPATRERFGTAQELVVLYSRYEKTDARVLTTLDEIVNRRDLRQRIDRNVVLLVHNGDVGDTEILLQSQSDWLVIPFTAGGLRNPQKGPVFVRSRMAAQIGAIDLYGVSSPIRSDRYFFGRDDLVQSLVTQVAGRQESAGLFGLRKTGKTSVLFAVQRRASNPSVLTEYLDCQNPGVHAARWWQVLEVFAQRIALASGVSEPSVDGGVFSESSAAASFTTVVKRVLKQGKLTQIVLMLDEIEYITPFLSGSLGRHWDKDFLPLWQTIRATHQETQGKLSFIVAGVNPKCVEESHFNAAPNPLFQLASPHYLEALPTTSVRDMVRSIGKHSGLRFVEDVYGYLQLTYGGHPYLIRLACSELWRAVGPPDPEKLTKVTRDEFITHREPIRARLSQPIKDILLSLVWWYPDEYDLLRIVAAGDPEFVTQYLDDKPQTVVQFARYGILGREGEFAIADLRQFLNEHGESYKREISPFLRGDMPPELLPEVPDLDVLSRLFEQRVQIEILLRKAIIMYLGIRLNWKNNKIAAAILSALNTREDGLDPADLFMGQRPQEVINELFVPDLKAIVLKHWDAMGNLFDNKKTRFEMNMDTLNVARRKDSHTKPVTSLELEEFQNSYTWLLQRLNKVEAIT